MHRPGGGIPGRRLPVVAGLACTVTALLLFFGATAPALAEHERLVGLEKRHGALLEALRQQNRALRQKAGVLSDGAGALTRDPQAVLVEIDALGLTPDELLARFPAPEAAH